MRRRQLPWRYHLRTETSSVDATVTEISFTRTVTTAQYRSHDEYARAGTKQIDAWKGVSSFSESLDREHHAPEILDASPNPTAILEHGQLSTRGAVDTATTRGSQKFSDRAEKASSCEQVRGLAQVSFTMGNKIRGDEQYLPLTSAVLP